MSDCPKRCLDDPTCKGYSVLSTNMPPPSNANFDSCFLYTTSNATSACTSNQAKHPNSPSTSVGQLNPFAECSEQADLRGATVQYHGGCLIKTEATQGICSIKPNLWINSNNVLNSR